MIITRKYALRLIMQGKADIVGFMWEGENEYAIVTRYDLQRTDHFATE